MWEQKKRQIGAIIPRAYILDALLWLNSLGKGGQEPERGPSTHLNPTSVSPA